MGLTLIDGQRYDVLGPAAITLELVHVYACVEKVSFLVVVAFDLTVEILKSVDRSGE